MNLGKLLKYYLQYAEFKRQAGHYVKVAEKMVELLNDAKAKELVVELRKFYERLP